MSLYGSVIKFTLHIKLAQARVRAEVGFIQDLEVPFSALLYTGHPFVGGYVRLVESIVPFQGLFDGDAQSIKGHNAMTFYV